MSAALKATTNGSEHAREILAKVRQAVTARDQSALREAEYAAIPREYRQLGQANRAEILGLLAEPAA